MNSMRESMWKAISDSPFMMVSLSEKNDHSLPMTAQLDPDARGKFWFYTTTDNRIAGGGKAMVQFVSKGHDLFACISGTLVHETDPAVIDRYWSKQVEAWYEQGRNDPSLKMMRLELDDAEVWVSHLDLKGTFKLVLGKSIDLDEAGDHAKYDLSTDL